MSERMDGLQDYVYSLLTGYIDPPAGVEIREGLNYNPYFPGGAIGMARVLYDGLVEYPDGSYFPFLISLYLVLITNLIPIPIRHPGNNNPNGQGRDDLPLLGSRARTR